MRKNVWKRFLAMALAAVVMFTSVDCTGLVVNAEGTTKTLGEILSEYYGVTEHEKTILTDANFKANTVTYDVEEPANLDGQITLDVVNKKISVHDFTKGNVVWKPESVKVFIDGQEKDTTFSEGFYQYDYSGTVEKAVVVYRPTITPSVDDQLMWLNAPVELETVIWETYDFLDRGSTGRNAIAPLAKEIYTSDENDTDIVSNLVKVISTLTLLENNPNFDAALELGTSLSKPSAQLKQNVEKIEANLNVLKSKFRLDNVFETFYETSDEEFGNFWLEYVEDLVSSLGADAMNAMSALADDGSLEALAKYFDSLSNAKAELETAISEKKTELATAEAELASAKIKSEEAEATIKTGEEKLSNGKAEIEAAEAELGAAEAELDEREAEIDQLLPELQEAARQQLAAARAELATLRDQLEEAKDKWNASKDELDAAKAELAAGKEQIATAEQEIAAAKEKLNEGEGLISELGTAGTVATEIRGYANTFDTFLGKNLVKDFVNDPAELQIFGADKIGLYFTSSPASIPALDGCKDYTDADVDAEIVVPRISTTVEKAADAYNVTVKIEADVVDLDANAFPVADARPLKSYTIIKSVNKNDNNYESFMTSTSAEILDQLEAWDLESEGVYGLSVAEDAYNLSYYSCDVTTDENVSGGKINGSATITVRYTPNTYTVKIAGETFATVSHGQYITFPAYTGSGSSTKSYEYKLGEDVYKQNDNYYVKADADFTRELVDALKINDITREDYKDLFTNDKHSGFEAVLKNSALISDTVNVKALTDDVCKNWISVVNTEEETLATLKTHQVSDEYTWVPRKVVVLNEGQPTGEVIEITADQIQNGKATVAITSDARTSIEVEYALVVAVGDAAYEYVNLPNELALGVKKQFEDWDVLTSYADDIAILNGTTLGLIGGMLSQEQKAAIDAIRRDCCEKAEDEELGSGDLLLNVYIKGFLNAGEDVDKIIYYYQNYEKIKAQLVLLSEYLPAVFEGDMSPVHAYITPEQVELVRSKIGKIGELAGDGYFAPRDERISDVSWNDYEALLTLLVPTLEAGSRKVPTNLQAVDESLVEELCTTYEIEKGNLPPSLGKTVSVRVQVKYNGATYESEEYKFRDKAGLGSEGVAWVKAQFAELSQGINTKYYVSNAETVNEGVTADIKTNKLFIYEWTAKEFTVEVLDENDSVLRTVTQSYTPDGMSISLPRPDSDAYMYVYSINGKTENVTYTSAGTDKSITMSFDDLFIGSETTLQITRGKVTVPSVRVNVIFNIDGTEFVTESTVVPFPETGMLDEHIQEVKAEAEAFAIAQGLNNQYYTLTSDVDAKLYEGITTPVTVTYTWKAQEFTFKLEDENGIVTNLNSFKYDKKVIELPVPSKGKTYVYKIGNSFVEVEPGVTGKYTLTETEFEAVLANNSTITRAVEIQKAKVTVKVVLKDGTGFELGHKENSDIVFNVPDGLGAANVVKVAEIAENLAAELATEKGIDKNFYDCAVTSDKVLENGKLSVNLDENATVTYTWTPRIYTVKFENGAGDEQQIPYDDLEVVLDRPESGYVYDYDFNGVIYPVVHDYTQGTQTVEQSIKNKFAEIFGNGTEVTVKRTSREVEATINITVVVESAVEGVASKTETFVYKFGIGAEGLSENELKEVKDKAAEIAKSNGADDIHYTYVSDVDTKLTVGHKDNVTNVKFTYSPKTYKVYVDGIAEQELIYGNPWVKVPVPEIEKYRYYYNINGKEEKVEYSDLVSENYDSVLGIYYKLVNVSSYFNDPTADFDSITITRRQVVAAVEDASNQVQNKLIGQDLKTVYDMLGVGNSVEIIQYNQVTDSEDTNGLPKAVVIRLSDTEETDGGIAKGVMAALGGLVLFNDYVWMGEKPDNSTGLVVEPPANSQANKTIRLQNAIDAILDTGIGTESIAGMFNSSNKTVEMKSIKDAAAVGNEPNNLGAELLKLKVGFGSNEKNSTELDIIFTFFDENVSESNNTIRNSIKTLREFVEVTGKDGRLTVDVKEPYSKEVFETYLMMMLLEGETDFANINNVTLTDIVEYEQERFVTDLSNETITIQTLENTMAKLGQHYDLNANPTIEKVLNKLLDAYKNNGYKDSTSSAFKFYLDENAEGYNSEAEAVLFNTEVKTETVLDAASTMGLKKEQMDILTNSLDDAEMSGYLDIPVKFTADGIDSNDTANNNTYAALVINDPTALANISGANTESFEIAANAIELVESSFFKDGLIRRILNPTKVPNNSMVVLLTDALADTEVKFEGNGILDLNGHKVKEVIGKNSSSTVVLVDSTYENSGSAVAGKNVKDARQNGDFYKIAKDGNNLVVKFNGEALANALETNKTELTTLAVEVAFDLIMNNITSGDMLIDEYALYDIDVTDDIFALIEDNKTDIINDVIDLVNLGKVDGDPKNVETEGLFGFINDILDSLTSEDAIDNIAACANNGNPIVTYTVKTNPVKVNLAKASADYLTAGIRTEKSKGSKEYTISLVVDQDSNKKPLVDLCNELADVVTESNINVDLDNIQFANKGITAEGASVNATLHVDLLRGKAKAVNKEAGKTEAAGNHDYAAIIAMVAAYAEKNPANSPLKTAVEAYLADGSIDLLRKEVENITTAQLIKAVKNANGKTFAEIAAKLQLQGNADSAKNLAAVYDDLFMVVYKLASFVSNKLGIDGDNSKLGSLLKKSTEKVGDVTFTYYSYGGDVEGSREVSKVFSGFGAKAEGSAYADLRLTLFAEDDYVADDDDDDQGGSGSGSGGSSENDGPVEVHPAPTTPTAPAGSTGTATGDANNMTLWISVMGLAIIAVVAAVATKKRKVK